MKSLILLPLFALLPLLAFSNGVPEITQDEKETTIEMIKVGETEYIKGCTATATYIATTPLGGIEITCIAKTKSCEEALRLAIECLEEIVGPL